MLTLDDLTARIDDTVGEVMKVIDANERGLSFVTGEENRLKGVATDGDIRRALLEGFKLSDPIRKVMNRDFVSLPVEADDREIRARFSARIKIIPLVDEEGRLADFADQFRSRRIPIMEPSMGEREMEYVTDCIRTNWISSQGKYVERFQEQFSEMHEGMHALAVSNGTVALHLALEAMGVGEGDEVIVPDLTFAASANAVIHAGAEPVFCDVDPRSWVMTAEEAEKLVTERTRAIMPVHLYGRPCDMEALSAMARRHGLLVLEDCAEALGSRWEGRPAGVFGDAAAFSFFGNKTITTGEGGMVLFKDEGHARRATLLRDHGMSRERRYWHEEVGYNYRMTNLQAAVGVAQMERFDRIAGTKRDLADRYRRELEDAPGIAALPEEGPSFRHSHWLFTLLLEEGLDRGAVIRKLLHNGVEARPAFHLLHEMPPYRRFRSGEIRHAGAVARRGLSLPSSSQLEEGEVRYICKAFKRVVRPLLED